MLTAKLALRNMWAHAQRSRIVLIVVGLVSCVVFLFMAFSDGQLKNFKRGVLALNDPAADVVVYARGLKTAYDQGEGWKELSTHSIKGSPDVLRELRALPLVRRAAPPTTALTMSLVAAGQRHENFLLRGVDPEQPFLVQEHLRMKEGAFLDGSSEPQVILHYKTRSSTGLAPGDTVILNGKDLFGQVVAQRATVKGFFAGEQDMANLAEIGFLNMAAYRLVSGLEPTEEMSIFVDLPRGADRATAIGQLQRWAQGRQLDLEFWDYDQLPRSSIALYALLRVYDLVRVILQAMSLIILGIVTFGIMSVVSVNLYDRKREIGTYYCLGSEKGFLVRLYTLEILLLNLAGTIAGVLAGLAIRQVILSLGIRTEDSAMQLVFGGSQFTLGFSPGSVAFIVGAMLVVTLVTALTTLWSRLRVSPVAALRETE